jgi:hypothetical protein
MFYWQVGEQTSLQHRSPAILHPSSGMPEDLLIIRCMTIDKITFDEMAINCF